MVAMRREIHERHPWLAMNLYKAFDEAKRRSVERLADITASFVPLPWSPSHLAQCLPGDAPIVAASDSVRAWPQLIGSYLGAPFTVLGTDGFGRSDTRAALRSFFEVDRHQIVLAALTALAARGRIEPGVRARAITRYGLATGTDAPWTI